MKKSRTNPFATVNASLRVVMATPPGSPFDDLHASVLKVLEADVERTGLRVVCTAVPWDEVTESRQYCLSIHFNDLTTQPENVKKALKLILKRLESWKVNHQLGVNVVNNAIYVMRSGFGTMLRIGCLGPTAVGYLAYRKPRVSKAQQLLNSKLMDRIRSTKA